jgi:hypothetical protein
MVTSAHRVEMEVGADGLACEPPSEAAVASPQAGAVGPNSHAKPEGRDRAEDTNKI